MTTNEVVKLNDQVLESWNKHDVAKFLELCDENIVWKDLSSPEPFRCKKGAGHFFKMWLTGFPDLKLKNVNQVVTEDTIAVEVDFSGTNTGTLQLSPYVPAIQATRKAVANSGSYFAKVRNGKVVEVHTYPDLA